MLCDNCGKREANVKYSENINGRRRELNLCEECSKKLGIGQMDFNMPIDFSSFLGGFMEDFGTTEFLPMFEELKTLKCDECGYTFDDITSTGRLGCQNCYDVFGSKIDPILKRMQGENRHVGRIGKIIDSKIESKYEKPEEQKGKQRIQNKKDTQKETEEQSKVKEESTTNSELEKLQQQLKEAIKEERYEDAAKLRDEIKKLEK